MLGDGVEDAGERADAELLVIGDRHVVLAALLRREAHVAARLVRALIAVAAQEPGELTPGEIAGSRTGRPMRR